MPPSLAGFSSAGALSDKSSTPGSASGGFWLSVFKATILGLLKERFIQDLGKEHDWAKGRHALPLSVV